MGRAPMRREARPLLARGGGQVRVGPGAHSPHVTCEQSSRASERRRQAVPRRASRGQLPRGPACDRAPRHRARRSGHPPLPGEARGPAPADRRAAADPLGPLAAGRTLAQAPAARRAARRDRAGDRARARPEGVEVRGRREDARGDPPLPRRAPVHRLPRAWPLLEPFAGLPVRRLHSIGTERASFAAFLELRRRAWTASRSTSACSAPTRWGRCGRSRTSS